MVDFGPASRCTRTSTGIESRESRSPGVVADAEILGHEARSIADPGIAKEDFERAVPDLAKIAFYDPSGRTKPRMPLIGELADLLRSACRGRGSEPGAAAEQLAHASK